MSGPPIGVFSLFRLPLGAFQPHDVLYVFDRDGHIAGLLRVERESPRDEWTVVELDAVGGLDAGDVRFRLVQHLLRDGAKRGAVRFHVACADADDNVELFMQAGFSRYGDERVLFRPPSRPLPAADGATRRRAPRGIRPATSQDAVALSRLYATVTPAPVQRLEVDPAVRLGAPGPRVARARAARSRRSSASRTWRRSCRRRPAAARTARSWTRFVQVGVAKEDQPHYLKVLARPEADVVAAAAVLRWASSPRGPTLVARHREGVLAPVRTYESPLDRRLEEEGFDAIATVTLLMKETLVRVAEPRLVPAGVR